MKRIITYLIFVFAVCKIDFAFAQPASLEPTLVGSTGNFTVNIPGNLMISSSVGEPVVPTFTVGTGAVRILTQGFQQPESLGCPTVSSLSVTPSATICAGASVTISPVMSGDTGSETYFWSPGGQTTSSVIVSPTITTAYTFSVVGCTGTVRTTTVTVNPLPTPSIVVSQNPICMGQSTTLSVTSSVGTAPFTYLWNPGGSTTSAISVSPTAATAYTITLTDVNGCSATKDSVIIVNPLPAVSSAGSNSPVCSGQTLSLTATASGAPAYSWNGPNSFSSTLQNPTISAVTTASGGTYSVTVNENGCASTAVTVLVTVNQTPTVTASGSNSPVCSGQTLSLTATASGAPAYSWNGPNSFSSTLQNPTISAVTTASGGTYSVTVSENGCTSAVATTSVAVNSTPTISISPFPNDSICNGSSVTLTAGGGTTYSWWHNGSSAAAITESLTSTTTYTVTGTSGSCSSLATQTITVNPLPTPIITSTGGNAICAGSSTSITASGGTTYSWSTTATTATIVVSPSVQTTYTVTLTSSQGCTQTSSITIDVNPTPAAPTAGSNSPVCSGQTLSLTATASGAPAYSWNGPNSFSSTLQNPTISAVTTASGGTYSVTVSENGCTSAAATVSVTVNAPPVASVSVLPASAIICSGSTVTLSENSGAGTYVWSPGGQTAASITDSPTITTTYTIIATNASGCSDTAVATVTVNPLPAVAITPSNNNPCSGDNVTLTANVTSGTSPFTYLWGTGGTAASEIVTVTASTTYTIDITDANGCTANTSLSIAPATTPTAVVTGSTTICLGQTVSLTASGGINYTWSTGASTAVMSDTPSAAGVANYTVNVDNGSCADTAVVAVTVLSTPTPVVTANDSTICSGNNAILTATGGTSYSWHNAGQTTSSINITPTATVSTTVTYAVSVSNGSCSVDDSISIIVYPAPTATLTASPAAVCMGASATLSAQGGNMYSWSTGQTATSSIVTPALTSATSYTVAVGNTFGCADTATITVNINATPTVTVNGNTTICSGDATTLTANSSTAVSYAWLPNGSVSSITVSPTANTGYTVTITDNNGCTNTDSITVIVTPSPTVAVSASADSICSGGTVTLTASSNGANYLWNPGGFTTSFITISPAFSVTYSVTVTTGSCSKTDSVQITVTTITAQAGGTTTVCEGNAISLTSTGGGTYSWSGPNGFTSASQNPVISPASTIHAGTYTVTVTGAGNCSDTDTITVNVFAMPTPSVASVKDSICFGSSATLTASGGSSGYLWSPGGQTTSSITPVILGNVTYTLTAFNGNCSADTTHSIFVLALPNIGIVSSDANNIICPGDSVTLTATGGNAYFWGSSTSSAIDVSPSATTTYTVLGQGINGCFNIASHTITVSNITVDAGADQTICPGHVAQLNATVSGAASPFTYYWSPSVFLNDSNAQNPSAIPDTTTTFYLEVFNGEGCYDKDTITVHMVYSANCVLQIFHGITPNNDGNNDSWFIGGIRYFPDNSVTIFNRWGSKVWQEQHYDNDEVVWKGTNQQNQPLPDGTYYYVIELKNADGRKETFAGWVEVTH